MHHDYDVLGRCKRCGEHKARFAEDEEPCVTQADRLRGRVTYLENELGGATLAGVELAAKLETREAEIKRLNEALVAADKRIAELDARQCPVCGSATDGSAL